MATRKSTRPESGRGASPGSGASRRAPVRRRAKAYAPRRDTHEAEVQRQLMVVVVRLRAIYGTAVSAELALRQQGAEQDFEVADCLRAGVCDPIAERIRELQEIIQRFRSAVSRSKS